MSKVLIEDYEKLKKENRELKQKLKNASSYVERFNILVENSYEWVWEVDANGVYTYASPQVKAVLGYEPKELIGKTPFDFMKEEEAIRVGKIFSEIASKEESFSKLINICIRKDGTEAHTETSGQPFYDEYGLFMGYRGIDFDRTQDINEYKNVESALEASNIRYKQLISELDLKVKEQSAQLIKKSRMAQIGELLSMIAHQWRQPLSSIGSVAMNVKIRLSLQDDKSRDDEEIKKLYDFINKKMNSIESFVSSLSNTIDDFRTLYKPDKVMKKSSIMKPINNAKSLVEASFIDNSIKVKESIKNDIALHMHQNEIMQVILNLLKNAEENFLVNDTKNPTIFIETSMHDDSAVINISDNGGGIPNEIQDDIFNPYFSTKDEKNGTGLGLYMCKIIVEDHHKGKLLVSNTDKGACFSIKLPIQ